MSVKIVSAQNVAYAYVTEVATSLSNRLAHPNPTGASSSCDPQDIIRALNAFMGSAFFARAHYNFQFQLEYLGLQVGRPSGCEPTCPASELLAGLEAVSGNDAECSRNSATTSSTSTTSSSAAAASSSASVPPTWNTSCVASDVFSDISCDASTRAQCPMGPDGTQRCYVT
jgi:hypothetical protein